MPGISESMENRSGMAAAGRQLTMAGGMLVGDGSPACQGPFLRQEASEVLPRLAVLRTTTDSRLVGRRFTLLPSQSEMISGLPS